MLHLIKRRVENEKAMGFLMKQNKYVYDVDPKLTKTQIKDLFYELYGVEIVSINTHILPLKKKKTRSRKACGGRPTYKRAIIKLKKGQQFAWKKSSQTPNSSQEPIENQKPDEGKDST